MQISSIIDIVNGELQNSPFVSFVTDIKINPHKVKQGDLFLVQDQYDIPIAINNGAFALLYDKEDTVIIDKEIAWIYCDDINYALICLMRYILTHHDLHIYYCDNITTNLVQLYNHDFAHPIVILNDNMFENIIALNAIQEHCFIFATDQNFLEAIYPDYELFNQHNYEISNHIVHSAFETSFSHDEHYFDRLRIASIYMDQFLDLYHFLDGGIDMTKLKSLTFFKPIFINKSLQIVDYGKSGKFIVGSDDYDLVDEQIDFLYKTYPYSNIEIIDTSILDNISLRDELKKLHFNIVYVKGKNYEQIVELLSAPVETTSLFQL